MNESRVFFRLGIGQQWLVSSKLKAASMLRRPVP